MKITLIFTLIATITFTVSASNKTSPSSDEISEWKADINITDANVAAWKANHNVTAAEI